ncbi:hypothetical protein Nmel_015668 [Mimus melanotis]
MGVPCVPRAAWGPERGAALPGGATALEEPGGDTRAGIWCQTLEPRGQSQDWPGTGGTHLGHPAPVPHGPAEHGEVTSRWPKQRWPGIAGVAVPWLCFAAPGCDGRARGLLEGANVGMGKEGIFPVLAGAGSLCGPGMAGQGQKENSNFTGGETGAAGEAAGDAAAPGAAPEGHGRDASAAPGGPGAGQGGEEGTGGCEGAAGTFQPRAAGRGSARGSQQPRCAAPLRPPRGSVPPGWWGQRCRGLGLRWGSEQGPPGCFCACSPPAKPLGCSRCSRYSLEALTGRLSGLGGQSRVGPAGAPSISRAARGVRRCRRGPGAPRP